MLVLKTLQPMPAMITTTAAPTAPKILAFGDLPAPIGANGTRTWTPPGKPPTTGPAAGPTARVLTWLPHRHMPVPVACATMTG